MLSDRVLFSAQDVRVIHRRCELLHAQKKFNDYAENALTLMKFYLRAVYHKRDIHGRC